MWAGGDEPLVARIDMRAETFQRSRAQKRKISGLGEYDLVDRFELGGPNDGVSHRPGYRLAVGHAEALILLHDNDANPIEELTRDPGELRPRVHKDSVRDPGAPRLSRIDDLAVDPEHAHTQRITEVGAAGKDTCGRNSDYQTRERRARV